MDLLEGNCATCNQQHLGADAKRCSRCKSMTYCSIECQREDWPNHKKICKFLNAGKAQQLRHPDHLSSVGLPEQTMVGLSNLPSDCRQLFSLFRATSPDEETRLAKMKKIVKRIPMVQREMLLHQSIGILLCISTSAIRQPTSPLLVILESGVDPNFLSHPFHTRTPDPSSYRALHFLAELTTPDVDKMQRQVILAQQLIEHGADVNARANPECGSISPLHKVCASPNCTNLDLIKLFLDHGASPNLVNDCGQTPLMNTLEMSPSAAKLLLTYNYEDSLTPVINPNIRADDGSIYLGGLVDSIRRWREDFDRITMGLPSRKDVQWTNPALHKYFLRQLEEVKLLAEERGAVGASEGWQSTPMSPEEYRRTSANGPPMPTTHHGPPLPYDVRSLLDKELLFGICGHPSGEQGDVPDWYRIHPFFVPDKESKQLEVLKRKEYLYTGKQPEVGMKLEIKAVLVVGPNQDDWHRGCLQGMVTEVGALPTDVQLKESLSKIYGRACLCNDPECCLTKTGKNEDIITKYGGLHGQEVKGIVSLDDSYLNHVPLMKFFRGFQKKYEVTLRMNDHKECMWEMCSISKVE